MYALNSKLNLPIDTMGRYFNNTKNRIVLPDNGEDDMYAGEYYPLRYPSENLSLEYLSAYQREADPNTIVLLSGIYENESSADSALSILKTIAPTAVKLKPKVYIGCMH